jgi:hypothetical protein
MSRVRPKGGVRGGNVYDQASRFLLRLGAQAWLLWLLGAKPEEVGFVCWLDTRALPWPGQPDRTCDTVAWLSDHSDGDRPRALVAESQVQPDPEMFGRLSQYLGAVRVDLRPGRSRGDRFHVGAVVVNLTGKGQVGQTMRLGRTRVSTELGVAEWNLGELDAGEVLAEVAAGRAPRLVLAWLPLMRNGSELAIIQRWLELARQETDKEKREALGLALVFAEKAGCGAAWREALKGWDVMESQVVREWTAQARAEGEAKGKAEGKAEALLQVLQRRFKAVPDDLRSAIQAVQGPDRLTAWIDLAFESRSLRQFRHKAGL